MHCYFAAIAGPALLLITNSKRNNRCRRSIEKDVLRFTASNPPSQNYSWRLWDGEVPGKCDKLDLCPKNNNVWEGFWLIGLGFPLSLTACHRKESALHIGDYKRLDCTHRHSWAEGRQLKHVATIYRHWEWKLARCHNFLTTGKTCKGKYCTIKI